MLYLNEDAEEDGLVVATTVDQVAVVATVGHGEEEVIHGELVDAIVFVAHEAVVDVTLTEAVRHLRVAPCETAMSGQLREHVHHSVTRSVRVSHVQVGGRQRHALPLADCQGHVYGERRQRLVPGLDGDAKDAGAGTVQGVGDAELERVVPLGSVRRVAVQDGLRCQVELTERTDRVIVRTDQLTMTWR